MSTWFGFAQSLVLSVLLGAAIAIIPVSLHAQTTSASTDLRAAVQTALLSDPRTASLPPTQLDAMIDVLTQKAQAQGMTAQDILYRPGERPLSSTVVIPQTEACTSVLCSVSDAFGFPGVGGMVIFLVFLLSGFLFLIVGTMLQRHRMQQQV